MQLPIPPSDSMYKFVCIGALLAIVALLIWSDKKVTDLERQHAELARRRSVTKTELDLLKNDVEILRSTISQTKAAGPKVAEETLPSIDRANLELRERHRTIAVKAAELEEDVKEANRLVKEIDRDVDTSLLQVGLFTVMFLSSLWSWYRLVQVYQDRMLRAQAETAELALKKARAEHQADGAAQAGTAPKEPTLEAKEG